MKIKESLQMAFMAIFERKKYKKINALLNKGWTFKHALIYYKSKQHNKIDELHYKTIDRLCKIANVIIEDSKKK